VTHHALEAAALGHLDGVQRLREGADLVDLDEECVGGALLDAAGEALGVGDEEVVADDLDLVAEAGVLAGERPLLPRGSAGRR